MEKYAQHWPLVCAHLGTFTHAQNINTVVVGDTPVLTQSPSKQPCNYACCARVWGLSGSHVCLQLWLWSLREAEPGWHFFLSPDSGWPIINVGTNERGNQRTQWVAIHYTWEGALGPASQTPQGGAPRESLKLCHAWLHTEELPEAWGHQPKAILTARPFHMLRPVEFAHSVFTVRRSARNWDESPCGRWQPRLTEPFIKIAAC